MKTTRKMMNPKCHLLPNRLIHRLPSLILLLQRVFGPLLPLLDPDPDLGPDLDLDLDPLFRPGSGSLSNSFERL